MEDEFLRRTLLLANSPPVMGLEADPEPAPLSPAFQRRMKRLLADPTGYARRAGRPMWRKVLQTAACVVLVCTVALGGLMAVSPTVRAWVSRIVVEWFTTNTHFRFDSPDFEGEALAWRPGWVPGGFEVSFFEDSHEFGAVDYQNEVETYLSFRYTYVGQDRYYNVDNEHGDYEDITVNGEEGHLIRTNTPGWPSHLMWMNEEGTVAFLLSGELPVEDLLRMAESVEPVKD